MIDFSSSKILIIGDVMLDQYWYGDSNRVSPEAPVPIVNFLHKELKLGGAANVAANVKSLGAQVTLMGIVGQDKNARSILKLLENKKIQNVIVEHKDLITTTKTRIISNRQQIVRIDHEKPFKFEQTQEIYTRFTQIVQDYDVVLLSDYNKGTLSRVEKYIAYANQHQKIVLVDPKGKNYEKYKNVFCITPNTEEFNQICGPSHSEEELAKKMNDLATSLNLESLLLTRGDQGITLWNKNSPILTVPTQAKTVYDVSGAGDTVIATLACTCSELKNAKNAQERHRLLQQGVHLANQAAGIAVAQQGSYAVSVHELNHLNLVQNNKYLRTQEAISNAVQNFNNNKLKVVFTNGCFDVLHSGHVHCLKQAAQFGDVLIVALNSDSSITRLKGEHRPINNLNDRIEVLSALSFVDWIVDFGDDPKDDDKPLNTISMIKPDVIIKGDDYTVEQVVGSEIVKSYGGKVKIIPLKKGYSTTKTIQALQKS